MEEEVIQMADGTTLRMSDLTFDDDDFKPEKKSEAVEGEIVKERKKPKREKSPLYK